ncbi:MAG: cysteine desulfurase family protein [Pseudomonadota bacterium]|nr:cysteine desulfurase family protein [Pseudomonadota bacterium]
MGQRIYLDYNATAKIRPEVIEALTTAMGSVGNASSVHSAGRNARKSVEKARREVAALVGATPDQVVFTSGGTEADNQVMRPCDPSRTFVSAVEHPAVLDACPDAQRIPVDSDGVINLEALETALAATDAPQMVALMLANNETGVLQPVAEAVEIAHRFGALLHCDAVQAVGKIPVDFGALGADTMAMTAHKFGGPQGIGALIVRTSESADCLMRGGGQEHGLRGGTESVAHIIALGRAAEISVERMDGYAELAVLRDWMEEELIQTTPGTRVFGGGVPRLPNTSKLMMPGVSSETQVISFDLAGIEVSAGSACSAGRVEPPYVLTEMGVSVEEALCAVRVSLGWGTTEGDIQSFVAEWARIVERAGGVQGAE